MNNHAYSTAIVFAALTAGTAWADVLERRPSRDPGQANRNPVPEAFEVPGGQIKPPRRYETTHTDDPSTVPEPHGYHAPHTPPPKMSREAKPAPFDADEFGPDPVYPETGYDPESQYAIYGGKRPLDAPRPLLEIGRALYSEGPLGTGIESFLGAKNLLFPQLLIYGDARTAYASNDNGGGADFDRVAVRLNLDIDLKITDTERLHAFVRPFDKGGKFTSYDLSGPNKDDSELILDGNLETLFFEGDIGSITAGLTDEYVSYDLPIAFGFLPLLFQNGVWAEDAFLGGAITIPAMSSPRFDISNMDITFFAGFDEITSAALPNDDAGKFLGVATFIETWSGYFEAGYAFVNDTSGARLDYHNATMAFTRRYAGKISNSVRAIVNFGQDPANNQPRTADGYLLLLENSLVTSLPVTLVPYFNFWLGVNRPQSLARAAGAGGVLRNTALSFETDGLTGFPTLDATANDTYGGAVGVEYLFNLDQQLVVEGVVLQTHGEDAGRIAPDDQYALGMRYQLPLNDRWIFRADTMYGWRQELDNVSGYRLELRRKF